MAKSRFPGKALKLNSRKRVRFRFGSEINADEERIIQIKSGLVLFGQLFGESDEEDEFDGFKNCLPTTNSLRPKYRKTKKENGKQKKKEEEAKSVNCDLGANSHHNSSKENNYQTTNHVHPPALSTSSPALSPSPLTLSPPPTLSPSPPPLINGLNGDVTAQKAVILVEAKKESKLECDEKKDCQALGASFENFKNSKKLVKDNTERTSKKFVLPMVSARSSRIIKPNKRLFSDFTSLCSTNQQIEEVKNDEAEHPTESLPEKSTNKSKHVDQESESQQENEPDDPVCRSIMFYTDSITEEFKGQVGRPPKRFLKKGEVQPKEEYGTFLGNNLSPSKDLKEDKVKEKIEKLLRSPWDNRIKQNSKIFGKERDNKTCASTPFSNSTISKSILRKARLNLNKQTLQKIRSPASVQRLVPLSEEETAESKCGLCQSNSCNTICRYGVSCCETCNQSINYFTEGLPSNLECSGGQGECQLVGLSVEERCMGCWLSRILLTCAMPSLLHDRLRKCLPSPLKDKVPTSLGRSFNMNSVIPEDVSNVPVFSSDSGAGGFGSLVDLPGGWKRKNGTDVVVISPSGEKFRSITKLEEYLKRQGINAQASVLFGNLNSKAIPNSSDSKMGLKQSSKPISKMNNVVVTTLPGGWTRRIKWRNTGDRFDTYVCSPDGRTFRSRKELSAYFQHIGKVDDIHKYFPVRNSTASCANSSENSEASSTEPFSSSETCSEGSTDEKSLHESDSEGENIEESNEIDQENNSEKHTETFLENEDSSSININKILAMNHSNYQNYSSETTKKSDSLVISNFNSQSKPSPNETSSQELDKRILLSLQGSDLHSADHHSVSDEKSETSFNSSDSDSQDEGGVNLNFFSKLSQERHKKSNNEDSSGDCDVNGEENKKEEKIVLKINKKTLKPLGIDGTKDLSVVKKKKRKKKKKHKHEKHSLEVEYQGESLLIPQTNPLVCDVDKINTRVTEQPQQSLSDSCNKPLSPEKPQVNSFLNADLSTFPCHPNDTWQTLLVPGISDSQEAKTKDGPPQPKASSPTEQLKTVIDPTLDPSPLELPAEEPSSLQPEPLVKKKPLKLSGFTTQHFGNGWGRKIKWNEKGQGKVSFLTSPDGQKIVSSIELLAYFKKAGKTMLNMDYYFPKDLVREPPKEAEPSINEQPCNDEALERLSPTLTVKEKIEERRKERNVLFRQPRGKLGRRGFRGQPPLTKKVWVQGGEPESDSKTGIESEVPLNGVETHHGLEGGPRVKHVCRSQAQVLGMPRAVFPSPDSTKPASFKKKGLPRKKSKFLCVTTPKGKRVLKKTIWCNKCSGCTTPNCEMCINCRDMKKYGGPGTKKKPCVKRKCLNPTKAVKDTSGSASTTQPADGLSEKRDEPCSQNSEKSQAANASDAPPPPPPPPAPLTSTSTTNALLDLESELDAVSDVVGESADERRAFEVVEDEGGSSANNADKTIFVPRLMKPSIEAKDKGDIRSGKECIPGTRVNIDYWQAYDSEEMLTSGFPIITSVPLQIDCVCFRCGSAGLEELLFCTWCCEGVHPFCLEEGEGPENDEEEALWVCKKCAVCHVCGGSGHYDLLQCSGCKMYYHLECLGPTSHISCQPSQEGIWAAEVFRLLAFSWPQQTPITDANDCCVGGDPTAGAVKVVLLEELERLQPQRKKEVHWEACLFSCSERAPLISGPLPADKKRETLVESVCIEDTLADLEEGEHICLEEVFDDLDECAASASLSPKEDDVVHFKRDCDLFAEDKAERKFVRMEEDEYLALKYKKILAYEDCPIEASLLRILNILHSELFEFLGYVSWTELWKDGFVSSENFKTFPQDVKPETSQKLCVSCIKCHGCGSPTVTEWIDADTKARTPLQEILPNCAPFCNRCLELRNSKNFCPICQACYEDDDFDSKMMECGRCKEWIHAICEGLTDEWYQILSFLPDSVEFVCKLCLKNEQSLWMDAISKELQEGLQFIINLLSLSKCAKHLIRIENKALLNRKADGNPPNCKQGKEKDTEIVKIASEKKDVLPIERDSHQIEDQLQNGETTLEANSLLQNDDGVTKPSFCAESKNCATGPAVEDSSHNQTKQDSRPSSKVTVFSVQNFERPHTRSYKASALVASDLNNKETIVNESEKTHSFEKENSTISFMGDDVNLKKCIVRLEDICKTSKLFEERSVREPAFEGQNTANRLITKDVLKCSCKFQQIDNSTVSKICSGACKSNLSVVSGSLLTPKKVLKPGCLSDFEDDHEIKKKDQNSPYSMIAKVSKDIDDDCLSSEESSFCSSDTEIESIFEDPDEPKDLLDIKAKVNEEKYKSVLHFHVDVMRVFEAGRNLNKAQTRNTKATYTKHMKERFPWFNVHHPNIFSLIDSSHPFPLPYSDHNYPNLKFSERAGSSLSWKRSFQNKQTSSPFKRPKLSPKTLSSSPVKLQKPGLGSQADQRKCLLCNLVGDADPCGAGRLLYLGQDEWLHVNCGLWSSEVYEEEDGGLQNVYVAVSRGKQIKCSLCLERGATVGCCHKSCQATYHFMCAKRSDCFFGEDKRIFCKAHIHESLKPIEDLRVGRCVFVNMDSEKRRWRQAATSKVNVIIGSLSITGLGKMVPDIDFEDALIPTEFTCTRMFWSTKDPNQRVKYFCKTRVVRPVDANLNGESGSSYHKTIDHSMDAEAVENEMAEVKAWQKEIERQMWAMQSRQTNIIPPQMCPLYREILQREKQLTSEPLSIKAPLPTRRHLFSPFSPANEYDEDDEEVVRLCVEELLDHISQSSGKELCLDDATNAETPFLSPTPACRWVDDNDTAPHLPDDKNLTTPTHTDDNNENLTNIVNSDDNEIISMVLKNLATLDSALQSTPSTSGRLSPLDLDFLAVCDSAINPEEKLNEDIGFDSQQQKIAYKADEKVPFEEDSRKNQVSKSFLEDDGAEAICQKLFEACDSQMQNQIYTLDQNGEASSCEIHPGIRLSNTMDSSAVYCSHESMKSDSLVEFKSFPSPNSNISQGDLGTEPPVQQNYESFPNIHDPHNNYYSEKDKEESHSLMDNCSQTDKVSSDHFNDFFMETNSKISAIDENNSEPLDSANFISTHSVANFCHPEIQETSCSPLPIHQGETSLEETSVDKDADNFLPQNSLVNGLKNEPETSSISAPKESSLPALLSLESLPNSQSSLNSIPPSASFPCNSATPSTRKQVCRVLPMLSTSVCSRRNSSASEQSETGTTIPPESVPSPGGDQEAQNERLCAANDVASSATESIEKKRKIHMKRNYRTVIKKYPLRSAFRKHTPYKTVQIEINETIEIPSEEDEERTVCRQSLKRKWSSEVIAAAKEDAVEDKGGVRGAPRRGKRKAYEAGTNKKEKQQNKHENDAQKEEGSKTDKMATRPSATRSHRVLKFSDDHNAITVSIVDNNNLCNFSQRKRRHRYRRKTVLQLDGAVDDSSSEEANDVFDEDERPLPSDQAVHSDLALHIKQQSLARSSPGEEGPYKCSKCKRLYRTKDSYNRHIETCTFEIDSSTSSEETEDRSIEPKEKIEPRVVITSNLNEMQSVAANINTAPSTSSLIKDTAEQIEEIDSRFSKEHLIGPTGQISTKSSVTNLEKLEELCTSPARLEGSSLCAEMLKEDKNELSLDRAPSGLHRQVRIAMKRSSDLKVTSSNESTNVVTTTAQMSSSVSGPEVFVPPTLSPVKFNPTVKKSASPRRYTNVRLFKGRQGYQYRRAPPQLSSLQSQPQQTQFPQTQTQRPPQTPPQPQMAHFQPTQPQPQASPMPVAIQSLVEQNPYRVQTTAYPSNQQYQGVMTPALPQVNRELSSSVGPIAQVMTVVSGPSVAVPQGYTLQYVGSFRDGDIGTPTANLLTYQTPQPMVMPSPVVVTPQPTPVVMPQVVNTNITYTIATPETLVINQPTAVVPSVHYVTPQPQPQPQTFQTSVIQPLGAMMSFNQPQVSPLHSINSSIVSHPLPISTVTLPQPSTRDKSPTTDLAHPSSSFGNPPTPSYLPPAASSSFQTCPPSPRPRPQAFIAPISSESMNEQRCLKIESSPTSVSRPLFAQTPPITRSVATVAPAVFTTSAALTVARTSAVLPASTSSSQALPKDPFDLVCGLSETSPRVVAAVRPRPTYSYRDAMKGSQIEKKRLRQELSCEEDSQQHPLLKKKDSRMTTDEEDSDSEREEPKTGSLEELKTEGKEVQSYKLVLRKDGQAGSSRFNMLPLSGPNVPFPSPEVKELRIKAKVSVGPKRKNNSGAASRNQWSSQTGKEFIFASKDTTSDLLVNEQTPNMSLNASPLPTSTLEDSSLVDKSKNLNMEPYIVFELTSEDGFKVESRHVSEVWQKVLDAVSEARDNLCLGVKGGDSGATGPVNSSETKGKNLSGLHMLGLTHNAVQYLLEQLPGAKDCHKYSFQFHRRPSEEEHHENASGCARSEAFKTRSPYDVFSWLASKHRRLPYKARVQQEEVQLSSRRATSLELPMAMRYRHLCETARETVGVFRSNIHGRGLFCKKEIDAGEMVIEYAGQVIRSSLCDMREKYYESKGIGCYMFRIDEETVIDATMHGNAARFINHSCDPNCYSRVVDILGKKHIIIFALRRIQRGEELTYDYKFPIEEDKIPCSCGARRCRKYLN